ncbi:Hypothetical protein MCYN_0665 [Mycoplasmopsis cynos C142]|uniref:Uncharacterized protein n=1 Tax=Mycoplasmopsis cynos (strain C142) TaxID=1246955 RepID=L0RW74_MYCC1|nr:Hypothetical protein MCYN_0665 [Mycoplasmopsis cynos C142]
MIVLINTYQKYYIIALFFWILATYTKKKKTSILSRQIKKIKMIKIKHLKLYSSNISLKY